MRDPGRSTQILSQLHETGFVSVASRLDLRLLERAERRGAPVIAESVPMPGVRTLVAVDDLGGSRETRAELVTVLSVSAGSDDQTATRAKGAPTGG